MKTAITLVLFLGALCLASTAQAQVPRGDSGSERRAGCPDCELVREGDDFRPVGRGPLGKSICGGRPQDCEYPGQQPDPALIELPPEPAAGGAGDGGGGGSGGGSGGGPGDPGAAAPGAAPGAAPPGAPAGAPAGPPPPPPPPRCQVIPPVPPIPDFEYAPLQAPTLETNPDTPGGVTGLQQWLWDATDYTQITWQQAGRGGVNADCTRIPPPVATFSANATAWYFSFGEPGSDAQTGAPGSYTTPGARWTYETKDYYELSVIVQWAGDPANTIGIRDTRELRVDEIIPQALPGG